MRIGIVHIPIQVIRHFLNSHFRVRFLIGCSDKLADVDIRLMMMVVMMLGCEGNMCYLIGSGGRDCSGSDMAPNLHNFYLLTCIHSLLLTCKTFKRV